MMEQEKVSKLPSFVLSYIPGGYELLIAQGPVNKQNLNLAKFMTGSYL